MNKDHLFGILCALLVLGYFYFIGVPMARQYFSWEGRIEKLESEVKALDAQNGVIDASATSTEGYCLSLPQSPNGLISAKPVPCASVIPDGYH